LIPLALAGVTAVAFYPALGCGFVNYDDPDYVTENPHVRAGLSGAGARWALASFECSNWHPLTWLSLQADAGWSVGKSGELAPFGFHLTSVLLHAASAALLFLALRALTGATWRSAAAALLFAVHPLRAESVAWVSERKDVLSVFFGLLALWAYAGYARRPSVMRYLAVAAALALGLMCKPMLVTLPCLLLVLDWWPLGRAREARDWRRLAVEKLPLLTLAVVSSALTFVAQAGGEAVVGLEVDPPARRIANAVVAYAEYLHLSVWPQHLAVLYPHRPGLSPATVAAAAVLLAALTAGAVALRRRAPYLLAGWLWYLGTLVPVLGLVQVGGQAYADRYTYFPQIGLLVALSWGVADLARGRERFALAAGVAAALTLAAVTRLQLATWKDSVALWENAVSRAGGKSATSLLNLGEAYAAAGRDDAAAGAYLEALDKDPDNARARANLGNVYFRHGRLRDAVREYRAAVRLAPRLEKSHYNLGVALVRAGDYAGAVDCFREALRLRPDYADARRGLGLALVKNGQADDGLAELKEAVRLNPEDAQACAILGKTLVGRKDYAAATRYAELAVRAAPGDSEAWYLLGLCHLHLKRTDEAINCFQKAGQVAPDDPAPRAALAAVRAGRPWPPAKARAPDSTP
jgi:tetratricopeptide (TPR) repeat protein